MLKPPVSSSIFAVQLFPSPRLQRAWGGQVQHNTTEMMRFWGVNTPPHSPAPFSPSWRRQPWLCGSTDGSRFSSPSSTGGALCPRIRSPACPYSQRGHRRHPATLGVHGTPMSPSTLGCSCSPAPPPSSSFRAFLNTLRKHSCR